MQQLFGTFPRHAGVGDGFAVLELVERSGLLIAGFQEAFHHDAADARLPRCDAGGDVFDHFGFAHFVLAAVAVRRVNDKTVFARAGRLGNLQIGQRLRHGFGIVVRAVRGAAQHQMAIGIALGFGGNHTTVKIDGQEMMFECGGEAGVRGRLDRTVGGVLEADRHRHARRELAMHLAFGVASANRTPANQVADVLRGDRVQPFRGCRQTNAQHVGQHLACEPHALANIELAVEIGIVDQTLPTDGGAWLFEIHAHHNDQLVFQFFFDRGEFCRVFVRRFRIMNRAWADDGKQTIVFAVEHIADFLTGLQHQIAHLIGEWNFLQKISGSRNRVQLSNIDIHGLRKHGVIQQLRILRTIWTAKT